MRDNTFKWLTTNYNANYALANGEEPIPDDKEPTKVRKLAGDLFLDDDEDEEMEEEEHREVPHIGKSEVEEYLFYLRYLSQWLLTF